MTGPGRSLLLGIDTGGTYTDAVVYDEAAATVIGAAKSPTTHHDLTIGITGAVDQALRAAQVTAADIGLVSMSTTLATNAIVEGAGRKVCAIIIGFDDDVVERGGLAEALGGDPAIFFPGGHDPHGSEIEPLNLDVLRERLTRTIHDHPGIAGVAVMAQFSVRNPAHELAAALLVHEVMQRPVTCSHVLSAKLNGPRRAVTAVLNARLVPIIADLVARADVGLATLGIVAPVMVVRGDGSLVSSTFVRDRPIETILSGPAASLVGAAHLSGEQDAIVVDIGGTTTDIAVLRRGEPTLSESGATVGGHETMVTAVAMHTHGLGGDSRVRHDDRAVGARLIIGPQRVVPVGLLALAHPDLVHETLERQSRRDLPSDLDGMFLWSSNLDDRSSRDATEVQLLARIGGEAVAATAVLDTLAQRRIAERLVRSGALRLAAFTPSDACHVLGTQATFDAAAAHAAASLFARRRDRMGRAIGGGAEDIATITVDTLVRASAEAVLGAAFQRDGLPAETVSSTIVQRALDREFTATSVHVGVHHPLVALGASAGTYYPAVARVLATTAIVPPHAEVANAVGAVVGRVRVTASCAITSPQPGRFVVHSAPATAHESITDARSAAAAHLEVQLRTSMVAAGAGDFETTSEWSEQVVDVDGLPMFIEGTLRLTGSGRPSLAR